MSIFAASGFYLLAAAGLLLISLTGEWFTALLPGLTQEGRSMALNLAYYVPFLIFPVLLWAARGEGRLDALRLNPISLGSTVKIALAALFSMLLVYDAGLVWMALLQKLGLNVFASSYPVPASRSELTLSILTAALIVPVGEELLFRGAMLSAWEELGTKRGVVATAALFAVFHGSLTGLPGQFYGGMMLALVVVWTDSLYAGFIFHGVYNASSLIMAYMAGGGAEDAAGAAQTDIMAALGGPSVLPALLLEIVLMGMLVNLLTRGLRMNRALQRAGAKVAENGKFDAKSLPKEAMEELGGILRDPVKRRRMKPEQLFGGEYRGSRGPLKAKEWLMLVPALAIAVLFYAMDILSMLGGWA